MGWGEARVPVTRHGAPLQLMSFTATSHQATQNRADYATLILGPLEFIPQTLVGRRTGNGKVSSLNNCDSL